MTSNQSVLDHFSREKKRTYDVETIMVQQDGGSSAGRYQVSQDLRWRQVVLTYAKMSPYVVVRPDGTLDGADVMIWDILGEKLGLDLSYVNGNNFNGMFKKV